MVELAVADGNDRLTRLGLVREAVDMARAAVVYPLGMRSVSEQAVAAGHTVAPWRCGSTARSCTCRSTMTAPGFPPSRVGVSG